MQVGASDHAAKETIDELHARNIDFLSFGLA